MKKRLTITRAKKLADDWFSLYVRLYGADYSGMVSCVTCGARKHFQNIDAGHFMSRSHIATRWHKQNVNPQCSMACNKFGGGKQYEHGLYIDKRYGKGTADKLLALAHTTVKWGVFDLIEIAVKYRTLARVEAYKRGIDISNYESRNNIP